MIQFFGFLLFLVIALCGFWGIIFFSTIALAWIPPFLLNTKKEKLGKLTALAVRPNLGDQEGVVIVYKK